MTPFDALKKVIELADWPDDDGCVEWAGERFPNGRGKIVVCDVPMVVPTVVFELTATADQVVRSTVTHSFWSTSTRWVKPSWNGRRIEMTCGKPGCYRPSHLKLGESVMPLERPPQFERMVPSSPVDWVDEGLGEVVQ